MPKLWWWIHWNSLRTHVVSQKLSRGGPKRKGWPPNHHLFSDYVSFGECKKMFSRMALFCFQICLFAAWLQLPQCYWGYSNIFTSTLELRQLCVLEVRIRLMMLLYVTVYLSLFYFLLIVSLLGWGNALNKPGQLHNHHVILLETEEDLLFSGFVYTKHVLIIISGVVQFQITIHYSSMVAVTTSKLTTGQHRQPFFSPPRAAIHDMLRQWYKGASPQSYLCAVKTPYSVPPSVTSRSWSWTGGGDGTQGNMQLLVAVATNWCRISAVKVDSPLFSQRGNL